MFSTHLAIIFSLQHIKIIATNFIILEKVVSTRYNQLPFEILRQF